MRQCTVNSSMSEWLQRASNRSVLDVINPPVAQSTPSVRSDITRISNGPKREWGVYAMEPLLQIVNRRSFKAAS